MSLFGFIGKVATAFTGNPLFATLGTAADGLTRGKVDFELQFEAAMENQMLESLAWKGFQDQVAENERIFEEDAEDA